MVTEVDKNREAAFSGHDTPTAQRALGRKRSEDICQWPESTFVRFANCPLTRRCWLGHLRNHLDDRYIVDGDKLPRWRSTFHCLRNEQVGRDVDLKPVVALFGKNKVVAELEVDVMRILRTQKRICIVVFICAIVGVSVAAVQSIKLASDVDSIWETLQPCDACPLYQGCNHHRASLAFTNNPRETNQGQDMGFVVKRCKLWST